LNKSNLLESRRQFAQEYKETINIAWNEINKTLLQNDGAYWVNTNEKK